MQRSLGKILCLLAALTATSSCTRSGFESFVADGSALDSPSAEDALFDLQGEGTPPTDVGLDSSVSRGLSCDPAQLVGSNQPTLIKEAAIMPDGLSLTTRRYITLYMSTRPTLDASFGDWAIYTIPGTAPENAKQDVAFFEAEGIVHAMFAMGESTRLLYHCHLGNASCAEVSVYETVTGASLNGIIDFDGPSLTSAAAMVFNVASTTSLSAVYWATPRDATFLEWDAELLLPSPPGIMVDDPAITADGSLIVMGDAGLFDPPSLLYSFRDPQGAYGPLQRLDLGVEDSSSPELFTHPDGSYELFFRREDGVAGLYHARCRHSP